MDRNIKTRSIKMKRATASYHKSVSCCITSIDLDSNEPTYLYNSNYTDLIAELKCLRQWQFPVYFDIGVINVEWLIDWVSNFHPSKMLLFCRDEVWSQFYEPDPIQQRKIFSRRAQKKAIPMEEAVLPQCDVPQLFEEVLQSELSVEEDVVVDSKRSPLDEASGSSLKCEIKEEDSFSDLEEYLKGKVFTSGHEVLDKLREAKGNFNKSVESMIREYKYVCRVDDLNPETPGYKSLVNVLAYFSIKSKVKRMNYQQRLEFESRMEFLQQDSVEEQMSTKEVTQGNQGEELIDSDKQGNVMLTTQREASQPKPPIERSLGFLPHSSASEKQILEQLTERWLEAGSFQWTTTSARGAEIDETLPMILPKTALFNNRSSPNAAPFNVHQFARFDMKVRVQVNSNKFQVGQLQVSWFYNKSVNDQFKRYDNIYSASQRIHGLISAGSSNDVVIHIPYWAVTSAIALKANESNAKYINLLDMGSLSIKVMNPLVVSTGVSTEADVNVWVSFCNIEFRAMKSSKLDRPYPVEQMDTVEAIMGISKVAIDSLYPQLNGPNKDNPPVSAIPLAVQPMASHAFCVTKGQPNVNEILRAEPLNQTPSVPGSRNSMTNLTELTSKWSFIGTKVWASGDAREKLLWSELSTPNALTSRTTVTENGVTLNYPSILNFLGGFFGYFRGEIELRFDFIANEFYSGRVGVFTVPGVEAMPKYADARQSAGAVFDLQEGHQFIYKIPYYNNTPFCRLWDQAVDLNPVSHVPSCTGLFVLNALRVTNNIPSSIDINVYVRGSQTFEFSILKPPSSCTFFNTTVKLPTSAYATINSDWAAAFTSGSRWLKPDDDERLSFFYNETTDYFTIFSNLNFSAYYSVPTYMDSGNPNAPYRMIWFPYYKSDTELAPVTWLARAKQYPDYPVVVCFNEEAACRDYAKKPDNEALKKALKELKQGPWAVYKDVTAAERDTIIGSWPTTVTGWQNFSAAEILRVQFPEKDAKSAYEDFVVVQSDEREKLEMPAVSLSQPSKATNHGKTVFGESENTIVEMCKRYQYFGCEVIKTLPKVVCLSNMTPSLVLSTHPIRRFEVRSATDRDNFTREGFISTLASMYAGYRGSMRFRLVLSDLETSTTASVVVVHRYNKSFNPQQSSVHVPPQQPFSFTNLLDTSYATKLQCSAVNPVVEFEVPFYNTSEYNSMYPPPIANRRLLQDFMESGQVWIYISTVKEIKVAVDCFYAVGDDMEFSCFQGIPQQISLFPVGQSNEQETVETESQGLISGITSFFQDVSVLPGNLNQASTKLGQASDVVADIGEKTLTSWQNIKDNVMTGFTSLFEKLPTVDSIYDLISSLTSMGGIMCACIIQILYLFISPTPLSIGIAMASITCTIIGISSSASKYFKDLVVSICNVVSKFLSSTPTQQNKEADHELAPMVSILWSIVLGTFATVSKIKQIKAPNFGNIVSGLFDSSGNMFRVHNFGTKFFSDFLVLLRRMYQYINKWFSKDYPIINMVSETELQVWMIESLAILEKYTTSVSLDKQWSTKLFQLQAQGAIIAASARASLSIVTPQIFSSIQSIYRDLSKRVEELKSTNCYAPFRVEPFVIWLYSKKVGMRKSTYACKLPSMFGKEFKLSPEYFSLTSGQKYFDGLTTEKFVILDDFLCTATNDSGELLAQFLQMVGSARLQLPRAAVEKKLTYDDFEFIVVTSNFADFQSENAARHKPAFERRRHVIVEFVGTPDEPKFLIHKKTGECSETQITLDQEGLDKYLIQEARKHREEKQKLFSDQLKAYQEALNSVQKVDSVEEYIAEFKTKLERTNNLFESMNWVEDWFQSLFKDMKSLVSLEDTVSALEEKATTSASSQGIEEEVSKQFTVTTSDESVIDNIQRILLESKEKPKLQPSGTSVEDVLKLIHAPCETQDNLSIFEKHPYGPDIHQDDFRIDFSEIGVTIFSNKDGTQDGCVCNCGFLKAPLYYRFKLDLFSEFLDKCVNEGRINGEQHKLILGLAEGGLYVDARLKCPQTAWVMCNRIASKQCINKSDNMSDKEYKELVERFDGRAKQTAIALHTSLACRCWSHLWSLIKSDEYKFEDIRNSVPNILWDKVNNLEEVSGWKLLVENEKLNTFVSLVRQLFGMWPQTGKICNVFHPFPKNSNDAVQRPVANTFTNRFRKLIGGVPVTDDENKNIWLYPWWLAVLKSIGLAIGTLTLISCLGRLIYNVVNLFKMGTPVTQMLTSGAITTGKTSGQIGVQARSLLGVGSQGEVLTQQEIESMISSPPIQGKPMSGRLRKVLKNVCFVVARTKTEIDGKTVITQFSHRCLGLMNSKVILCAHYLDHFRRLKEERGERVSFFLIRPSAVQGVKTVSQNEFFLDKLKVYEFGENGEKVGDMIVVDFGKISSNFGDIRNQIPSCNSGLYKIPSHCMLISGNLDAGLHISSINACFNNKLLKVYNKSKDTSWNLGNRLTYNVGGDGMCGSIVWNENLKDPLIGFHTAGIGVSVGFSELLLKEELFPAEVAYIHAESNMDCDEKQFELLKGNYEVVGTISNSMKPHIPRSSRIVPSLAHGLFETRTEPAPLAKTDPRLETDNDPLIVGINKRFKPMVPIDSDDLELASRHVFGKFIRVKPVCDLRKLSVSEAIEGLRGIPRSTPIEMTTSEGYPWVKLRPKGYTDKRWLFDNGVYEDGSLRSKSIDDLLDSVLKMKSGLRQRRVIPLTYYTAMLKDARILKEKCKIPGKTRVFEMSPIDLTIAQRQFQLPFILTYMNNNLLMENTIGINVNGQEWNDVAYSLLDFSPNILAGDYSSYGPSIDYNVLSEALELITTWSLYYDWNSNFDEQYTHYSELDEIEFKTLNQEIMTSPIVCDKVIVRPTAGMASGNAATVVINSIVNSLYIRCAYLYLARQYAPRYKDLSFFDKYVFMFSNGDDVIMSVKEEILDWFNNHTLGSFFERHGLKFTNSKKDGSNPKFESLDQVSYLKCMFKPHPFRCGYFMAALDKVSIEDCCQWIWKGEVDEVDATILNCEQAVRLAYGHGPKYYNYIKNKVEMFFRREQIYYTLPEWKYLDQMIWDEQETIVTWI